MSVIFYNKEVLKQQTRWRYGEVKFGEEAVTIDNWEELKESKAQYVLVGIPEDVGVRANYGSPGAAKAWKKCLSALCNVQSNEFTNAKNLVILGEIDCAMEMQDAHQLTSDDPFYPTKIGSLVKEIDNKVSDTIEKIVRANKTPIIIGGGHNNSYGNLKGISLAYSKPIHCINMDAHTDFRPLEHRHSGNGFSHAYEDGFLGNYFIFGLHRNYTSASVFDRMEEFKKRVKFNLFEDLIFLEKNTLLNNFKEGQKHVVHDIFGLELDLDAIAGMGSSAMTPTGFSLEEARQFIRYFSKHKNCGYVHLCEGAPEKGLFPNQVAKALANFITDIISK